MRGKQHNSNVGAWDGGLFTTLKGDKIVPEFIKILDDYIDSHYPSRHGGRSRRGV